ncbi:homoserine dehydrogenase [Fictibacillus terranigra]|uniref:Homoserine dehydrogenase n=1 Tax=Fictibacillus terranigra TaxID=3058424 RepID=A0ABT8E382_9BACL|nr:homoserine dehydrogenase [Fictibacillus sp. CENA-BCM004]MDN4072355.1 homoserine dehydrogenase [Fictibacillus sp. CENA-BCM004]
MVENVSVGLLGLGTVGSGVVRMVEGHQEELLHRVGCPVYIEKVLVQNLEKERACVIKPELLTSSAEDVVNHPDIDVVIEVIGGIEQAREYILQALNNKKHVITANKDLMALHGAELLSTAEKNGCDLFYEASVAGGIPIIRTLVDGLASDRITKMMGIVNGTTNYILTKMDKQNLTFEEVLKEAQELGYAESDPTSDVEGIDAARKMAILASLGFSMNIHLDDVEVKGISNITSEDLEYARQFGYSMKLIGNARKDGGKVEVSVEPTLLPDTHPLASVQNENNAVYIYGEAVGETMFFGPGAGQLPTATSIVSDLVAVVRNMRLGVNGKSVVAPQFEKQLKQAEEIEGKYFYRLHVKDEAGTFSALTSVFAENQVSLEKLLQKPVDEDGVAEVVLVTHTTTKHQNEQIYQQLRDTGIVKVIKSHYRVEGGA